MSLTTTQVENDSKTKHLSAAEEWYFITYTKNWLKSVNIIFLFMKKGHQKKENIHYFLSFASKYHLCQLQQCTTFDYVFFWRLLEHYNFDFGIKVLWTSPLCPKNVIFINIFECVAKVIQRTVWYVISELHEMQVAGTSAVLPVQ